MTLCGRDHDGSMWFFLSLCWCTFVVSCSEKLLVLNRLTADFAEEFTNIHLLLLLIIIIIILQQRRRKIPATICEGIAD